MENVTDLKERWGGDFQVGYREKWRNVLKEWKKNGGAIVHLTMYGEPVHEAISTVKNSSKDKLVVVGGSRVPSQVYQNADWNISVTTQPHSEVSALALFLHMYYEGEELVKEFKGGKLKVVPKSHGKKIIEK